MEVVFSSGIGLRPMLVDSAPMGLDNQLQVVVGLFQSSILIRVGRGWGA